MLPEGSFAVAYNDVDYAYRLIDRGLRCVYCAGAELTHHEALGARGGGAHRFTMEATWAR